MMIVVIKSCEGSEKQVEFSIEILQEKTMRFFFWTPTCLFRFTKKETSFKRSAFLSSLYSESGYHHYMSPSTMNFCVFEQTTFPMQCSVLCGISILLRRRATIIMQPYLRDDVTVTVCLQHFFDTFYFVILARF